MSTLGISTKAAWITSKTNQKFSTALSSIYWIAKGHT